MLNYALVFKCPPDFVLSVQPSATEKVDWFPECTTEIPDSDELREWLILGQVNVQIIH